MVERMNTQNKVSQASAYQNLKYYSAVTAGEAEGTAAQTQEILRRYDEMLADRNHIVSGLVMLSHEADADAFFSEWNSWIPKNEEPALTVIRAGLAGGAMVSIALNEATTDEISRTRLNDRTGMMVRFGGVVYLSGRSVDGGRDTLREQSREVMRTYDNILAVNNLRKENILNGNIFVQDITMQNEYENVWIGWSHIGHKPSGTMVEGRPVNRRHQLELGLTFADSDKVLTILRKNPGHNCCRFVTYNGISYFTGNVCHDPDAEGLYEHSKKVFAQLEAQINENGMKKEDIIVCNAYIKDIDAQEAFEKAWDEWVSEGNEPARTICGTRLLSDRYEIEFTITVACKQK